MLQRIQWPTVAIVAVFIGAYVALTLTGHPVPEWLAVIGTLIAGAARGLVSQQPAPELPAPERPTDPDIRVPQ